MVRMMAPGHNIVSASPGGGYRSSNGTSMATPHAAGAFAILRQLRVGSTVDDIAAALECTGVPVTRSGITENRIRLPNAKNYVLNPQKVNRLFDFNTAGSDSLWVPTLGTWQVTLPDGVYDTFDATAGFKVSTTYHCNESFTITANVARLYGVAQSGNSGVLFKTQFTGTRASGYYAAFDSNGAVTLYRLDNYDLGTNTGNARILCAGNATLSGGPFNALRVVTKGGTHQVYVVNMSAPVCTGFDRAYGTGRAGLAGFFQGAGNRFGADFFYIVPNEFVPASSPVEMVRGSPAETTMSATLVSGRGGSVGVAADPRGSKIGLAR
jgi:hypothetical protein